MKVTGITVLDTLNADADVLTVEFDDGTSALMFYKYADALPFLNKEVVVDFRQDLYKGQIVDVVNTFTTAAVVHTLTSDDNIKLYSDAKDNHSNVTFADLDNGETMFNAVMYCVNQTLESSDKAVWAELTVRDSQFKVRKLRLFDPDRSLTFKGKYIICDIRKNQYGLSTTDIRTDDTVAYETPDVAICRDYCIKYFAGRDSINAMLDKTQFWEYASNHVNVVTGGDIVQLAYELRLLSTYKDMLPGLMYDALDLSLLLMHMGVKYDEDQMSPELRAVITASNHPVDLRRQAMYILDGFDNDVLAVEKRIFKAIRKQAIEMLALRYD